MAGKQVTAAAPPHALVPLPQLVGRVAVLGGRGSEKTTLLVGLALRQSQQHGTVLCLDARRHRQTEVQFRLLLRGSARYVPLPASGEVPVELAQLALSTISQGLATVSGCPPLLLLDSVRTTSAWEQTLAFLLNAGATVVEFLHSPGALAFGRYDTVLLGRTATDADACSRAVGRKVSAADLMQLKAGEGILIQLARVQRVVLPLQ